MLFVADALDAYPPYGIEWWFLRSAEDRSGVGCSRTVTDRMSVEKPHGWVYAVSGNSLPLSGPDPDTTSKRIAKKQKTAPGRGFLNNACVQGLHRNHVIRLRALLAVFDVELYLLTLGQGLETRTGDGAVMDKNILTAFHLNKPEALGLIEPFNSTRTSGHSKTSSISNADNIFPPGGQGKTPRRTNGDSLAVFTYL